AAVPLPLRPLKAVVPPLTDASAVPPALPVVWSHARNTRPPASVPLQLKAGTKRTRVLASAGRSRADAWEGAPKAVQLVPPFNEYCQVPLLLSTEVTAMPESAPGSGSLT